jgi:ribosomal protein L10
MKEMIISEYQSRFGELDSAVLVEIRGMDANENNVLRG